MLGQHNLDAHLAGPLHDRIKVLYLEPQQYTISVWLVITIADTTVMVLYFEAVQLKRNLSAPEQLLIGRPPMTALASQQTLIPPAACFHIGYRDQRLRTHRNQRNNYTLRRDESSGLPYPGYHRRCGFSSASHHRLPPTFF